MKLSLLSLLATAATSVLAHPEALTKENLAGELVGRSSTACASQIEARKSSFLAKRTASLHARRSTEDARLSRRSLIQNRDIYSTIQNDTCVLAPEAVWGPYAIDEEIYRHDLRESQSGVDLYLDIGLIDIETCEPLPNAYLTIWHCNATGSYSGFTGLDPNTVELLDGWTKNDGGTTDEETFLRGVMATNEEGVAEFLTVFPGYYVTRSTHIHLTVSANVSSNSSSDYSFGAASVQHVGQLFFEEDLINSVYELDPYNAHLSTLNRTLNSEDSVYATANTDGYSAVISVEMLGSALADGLVGYITVGVNASAAGVITSGGSVNPIGVIPTLSVAESARAAATAVDVAAGY